MVASCCALLARVLHGQVALPGSAPYNSTQASYWSTQEAALQPACIVQPQSARDVAQAVSTLAQNNCKFAVKSQGHAPTAGFANIQNGVTIDMTTLGAISLSADKQIAHVGTGASWLDVYAALDPHNVTVAGGRNGQVGVGGLTIGGGISYIGPRVGWACDNVVNWEVVLGSGEIVNANSTCNSDLWRALKGGANNFGVVTRIDFQTFSQGDILAGFIYNPFSERQKVYEAFTGLANATHYDPYAEMVTSFGYNPTSGWSSVLNLAAYTKPETSPPALQPFVDIPGSNNSLHITPIHTWSNESAIPVLNEIFYTGTYGVSAELMSTMIDKWDAILKQAGTLPGVLSWGFAFEPLPTVYTQYGAKKGGNSLGTSPADGNAMILLLGPTWNGTSHNAEILATTDKLLAAANDAARSMGLLHEFQYLNYASPTQKPLASYGAANFASLKAASRKYDPKGVFQTLVPGGFKLSEE